MDKKSKILLWVVGAVVILSALATWYRTMTVRDFEVITEEEVTDESAAGGTYLEGEAPTDIPAEEQAAY